MRTWRFPQNVKLGVNGKWDVHLLNLKITLSLPSLNMLLSQKTKLRNRVPLCVYVSSNNEYKKVKSTMESKCKHQPSNLLNKVTFVTHHLSHLDQMSSVLYYEYLPPSFPLFTKVVF